MAVPPPRRSGALSSTRQSSNPPPEPTGVLRHTPFGNVWQWTSSAYSPYPGFEPAPGVVGEYNGKFMVNQYVLRGGSVSPAGPHPIDLPELFAPSSRWAVSGLRLARAY